MEEKTKLLKKKIVVFVPEFPVLTETFIERDLAKLAMSPDLDIVVLSLRKGNGVLSPILKDHVHYRRITVIDLFLALRYVFNKSANVSKALHVVNKDSTKSSFARFFLFLKALAYSRIFASFRPNEIHAHFLSDPSTIAMVASIILEIPFSINAHARDVLEYPTLPISKGALAKFIAVCNANAFERCKTITKQTSPKIALIHHGINVGNLYPDSAPKQKSQRPMLFMGGTRLTEKKGIEYMLEASQILVNRGVAHEVILIGLGPMYAHYQSLIKEKGLENNFLIKGDGKGMPFTELAKYYQNATLFVLPIINTDKGDADGIPNVIIEAALAKLPIITTNAGSVTELIMDDVTGVIVPQKNSEILATEIERLIFDDPRKERLGNSVYLKALDMFDQTKNVGKLEALLLN